MNVTQIEKQVLLSQGNSSIRALYASLMDCSNLCTLALILERELGVVTTEEMWGDIWGHARKISVCNQTTVMQFTTYTAQNTCWSKPSLQTQKGYLSVLSIGDLTHSFWFCVKIEKAWTQPGFPHSGSSQRSCYWYIRKNCIMLWHFVPGKIFFSIGSQIRPPQWWDGIGQ